MIQADISVSKATLSNREIQQAFSRFSGTFYNSNSLTPTNDLGEVFISVAIGDQGNGIEPWYLLQESTATNFSTANYSGASMGPVNLNTTYTASIAYDGSKTFSIIFNNGTPIIFVGPNWMGPADSPFRDVGTSLRFGQDNITISLDDGKPDSGTAASIRVTVDNINVTTDNPAITHTFSGASLDQSIWDGLPGTKDIVGEALVMKQTSQERKQSESL